MEVITHSKHATNLSRAERWASLIAGGALAAAGAQRRSRLGVLVTLAGASLIYRGATGHSYLYEVLGVRTAPLGQGADTTSVPYELGIRVDEVITVNQPRAEVYRFWRDLHNLPRFMRHVESVRVEGGRSHWVVKGPAGQTVEWDAVIHSEVENERLAWRSLPGSRVDHAGSVIFTDAPGGRGTQLRVELQYNPPGGAVAALLARFWRGEPSQQIREDLRRFKQIAEGGEIVTVEGQARGAANPPPPSLAQDAVERASEASFPASDAPAFTRGPQLQEARV
jgi:uncharacterized membrane protein